MTKTISRRSLHDELADRLRDMIIQGTLIAGEKVPERELTEMFGVSRTPLREALKVLAVEGLVTLNPNRGSMVTRLTRRDIEEIFPVIGAIEGLAGQLACQRITAQELAAIESLQGKMVVQFQKNDLPGYFATNESIHEAILRAARNETLLSTHKSLSGRIRRSRYTANLSSERWAKAVAEHEEIFAVLRSRDGDRLSLLMQRHMQNKMNAVLALMDNDDEDEAQQRQ